MIDFLESLEFLEFTLVLTFSKFPKDSNRIINLLKPFII